MAFEIPETDADVREIFEEFAPRSQNLRWIKYHPGEYDPITGKATNEETLWEFDGIGVTPDDSQGAQEPAYQDRESANQTVLLLVPGYQMRGFEPLSHDDEIQVLPDAQGLYWLGQTELVTIQDQEPLETIDGDPLLSGTGEASDAPLQTLSGETLQAIREPKGPEHPRVAIRQITRVPEVAPALYKVTVEIPRA